MLFKSPTASEAALHFVVCVCVCGGGGFQDRISLYNSLAVLEHLIVQRPHPPLYESIKPLWIWCRVSNTKHSSKSEMWTLQETCLDVLSDYPELRFLYSLILSLQNQNYAIASKFLFCSFYFPCSTPVTPNVSAISYCMLGMQTKLNSPSDGSADKLLPSLIRGEGKIKTVLFGFLSLDYLSAVRRVTLLNLIEKISYK